LTQFGLSLEVALVRIKIEEITVGETDESEVKECNLINSIVLGDDSCVSPPSKPNKLFGYYHAYRPNSKLGKDFNISSSIDYIYYVSYGPNDLVNNNNDGGGPSALFSASKFNDLLNYKNSHPQLKIDIDYPVKFQCNPFIGSNFSVFINSIASRLTLQTGSNNKMLTITAGQYPINMSFNNISFVNIKAFGLNIDTGNISAGIEQIKTIWNNWNSAGLDDSKFVLAVEFGGIAEIVSSSNIRSDIDNQQLHLVNGSSSDFKYPFPNEPIQDQCYSAPYVYWSWTNLSGLLSQSSSCPTNLTPLSPRLYAKTDFVNSNGLAGIAIADITKDSNDLRLTNFISGILPPSLSNGVPLSTFGSTPSQPSSNNTGAIVGGVIGSFIFVSVIAVAGFMLYRKHRAKMSDPLIDTNNQTCSDTNRQDYSDIKHQVRPDTHNRIYSDTNHQTF
ncbi:23352_t:CDS:2, partial [Dentiscutata erythropus]